jgi:tetratricopeptide (TPR) repeat protein
MKSAVLFFLRYILIVAAIAAAFYSGILSRAAYLFHQDTANSIPAAARLVPYNAEYAARLASWQPDDRMPLLHRAVELNPFDSDSWIQLGLLSEMKDGDAKTAEGYFARAAEVNHMFLPKWTLTNFYFRRQKLSDFFKLANATLKITPYASDPVFTQMWLMSQDPARIAAAIPDKPRILVQYTWFLSNSKQYSAIPPIVQRLATAVGSDDPRAWGRDDLIAASLDHILASGDTRDALQVWTTLRDANWIKQSVPDARRPLTNGDFRLASFHHGFDWMAPETEGVRVEQFADEPSVRITLNGDQPEHCVLFQQYVPVQRDAIYNLQWKADSQNIEAGNGLAWHLRAVGSQSPAAFTSGDLLVSSFWPFRVPPAGEGFMLTLEYNREMGRIRPTGSFALRSVSLSRQR